MASYHLKQLKRWQKPGNARVFHQWWDFIVKRGRRSAAARSRYFDATAMTAKEEAEGWAEFHKELRTSERPVDWESQLAPQTRIEERRGWTRL